MFGLFGIYFVGWFSAILSLKHSFSITQRLIFKRNSEGFAEIAN